MVKFLRRLSWRYSKLGKHRRSSRVWRKPKGRDNKMREKLKGYPVVVSIGYKKAKAERQMPIIVNNVKELMGVTKDQLVVIAKVGMKKRVEMVKKAKDLGIVFQNINVKNFLKNHDHKNKSGEKVK